jgi:hypothetical protein
LYNIAIFLVFAGLLTAIWPFNNWIAVIIAAAGVIVEVTQVNRTKRQILH